MFYSPNRRDMKKLEISKSKIQGVLALLFAILSITASCEKKTEDPDNGGNNGGSNEPPANEVYIQGSAFNPASITVAANTNIKWTNKDGMTHTVTSNTGVFNSGNMLVNGTFSFTFTTPGTYAYRCTLHPAMTGTVIVN